MTGQQAKPKSPDQSVKLPEAVVRAAARSAELVEQQRTGSDKQSSGMVFADVNSPTPPTPQDPSSAAVTPSASANNQQTQGKTYSESEYRAMLGRLEKSQREQQDLIRRVNEQQRLLATVGQGDTQFNNPVNPAVYTPKKYVTPEEEKEWTTELLDVVRKAAREVAEAELAPVRGEVQQVRNAVGGVQSNIVANARTQLYEELAREVPDWEVLNNDDGFKAWVSQLDPLSGNQRLALLQDAYNKGQATRVIAAFKGYKEQATSSPVQARGSQPGNGAENAGGRSATNPRSNSANAPAVDLAALAAPGRARSGQQTASPDKPIVTGAEISQFYADVTRGKYAGRDEEYALIERQIQEALAEGRVRR